MEKMEEIKNWDKVKGETLRGFKYNLILKILGKPKEVFKGNFGEINIWGLCNKEILKKFKGEKGYKVEYNNKTCKVYAYFGFMKSKLFEIRADNKEFLIKLNKFGEYSITTNSFLKEYNVTFK